MLLAVGLIVVGVSGAYAYQTRVTGLSAGTVEITKAPSKVKRTERFQVEYKVHSTNYGLGFDIYPHPDVWGGSGGILFSERTQTGSFTITAPNIAGVYDLYLTGEHGPHDGCHYVLGSANTIKITVSPEKAKQVTDYNLVKKVTVYNNSYGVHQWELNVSGLILPWYLQPGSWANNAPPQKGDPSKIGYETTWPKLRNVEKKHCEQTVYFTGKIEDKYVEHGGGWSDVSIRYEEDKHTLTVEKEAGGTVSPSPGTYEYYEGREVTLTASPNSGYRFEGWTGSVTSSSKTITVDVSRDMTVRANFEEKIETYALSTSVGAGKGSVSVSPAQASYKVGTDVTVTASPAQGYDFDHWSGDASGTSKSITVTMTSDKSVVANFVEEPEPVQYFGLTTEVSKGKGSISVSPAKNKYKAGTEVTLTAKPAEGYSFHSWGGDASGSQNPTTVVMNSDKHVTASFDEIKPKYVTLEMSSSPPKGGSISITEEVRPMGPAAFPKGTEVTVEAFPNEGYRFSHWTGDAGGTEKVKKITMSRDKQITAVFEEAKTPVEKAEANADLVGIGIGSVMSLVGLVGGFTRWL
nr:hypothetical protein [uncultured archaeon]